MPDWEEVLDETVRYAVRYLEGLPERPVGSQAELRAALDGPLPLRPQNPHEVIASLAAGVERADSWATDAHKWLNVPYDSGLVFCAHPEAHRAAMGARARYLVHGADGERDALDYGPERSRRAGYSGTAPAG